MKLLFVKASLTWPRSSGHDVHAYHMMRAIAALGHDVSLATAIAPPNEALDGLGIAALHSLETPVPGNGISVTGTWLQRKFRGFYGVPEARIARVARIASAAQVDAVVLVGLDVLPFLPGLSGVARVWYAADEWVWHHLSQLNSDYRAARANLRDALLKGVYERAHAGLIDRVWVVSHAECQAMRWLAGIRNVDVVPNGVDATFFAPGTETTRARSAVFWGRLDFSPNIQALEWFCARVWPLLLDRAPDATFTVVGFHPIDPVARLARLPGVQLMPDVPDLRSVVRQHEVVVLPFVSGGGIKNKLLEAAAMGQAIVCTAKATRGLRAAAPLMVASSASDMSHTILNLWNDAARRRGLGESARAWVTEHHTWEAAARQAMAGLAESVEARRRGRRQ
jgi:glycosyltransferase involved in cell wall biosynthesis